MPAARPRTTLVKPFCEKISPEGDSLYHRLTKFCQASRATSFAKFLNSRPDSSTWHPLELLEKCHRKQFCQPVTHQPALSSASLPVPIPSLFPNWTDRLVILDQLDLWQTFCQRPIRPFLFCFSNEFKIYFFWMVRRIFRSCPHKKRLNRSFLLQNIALGLLGHEGSKWSSEIHQTKKKNK